MTTEMTVNGNTVLRSDLYTHRWCDAYGPDVCKLVENFVSVPFSAADNLCGWTTTLVEAGGAESTIALVAGSAGGELLFTSDTNENDGCQIQLKGEAFYFNSMYPTYVGARFKVNDADQVDALLGLAITDTTAIVGVSDGLYFRTVDESAILSAVAEKDSSETVVGVSTLVDDTYVVAEMLYRNNVVKFYINGVEVGELADSDPNFPDDEYLTPTLALLTGEGAANTLTVDWLNVIQIQAT